MGRKIPGRKHKGVKDPEKQRATKLNSLKGKINAPPVNPDFQEIPHSVSRIAELKDLAKGKRNKNVKNKQPKVSTKRLHEKYQPKHKKKLQFRQRKGESDKQFLYRVQKSCDTVIQENAFENKYGVDIKRNPETGEVERLVKKPKDELEEYAKKTKQAQTKKGKRKRKAETEGPHLTKSQKRQRKLTERKQKKAARKDPVFNKDIIKFGEVVHAPPTLTAPKKVIKANGAPRPGQKNLLLKSIIQSSNEPAQNNHKQVKNNEKLRKTANKPIDKMGKRKNLPNALRRRLEKQQAEIISAYRLLKKSKKSAVAL